MTRLKLDGKTRTTPLPSHSASAGLGPRDRRRIRHIALLCSAVASISITVTVVGNPVATAAPILFLGPVYGGNTAATGVSGDGSVVSYNFENAGSLGRLWVRGSGTSDLLPAPGLHVSTALAVSQDGNTVVGTSGDGGYATSWQGAATSYGTLLPAPPYLDTLAAKAVSSDGSTIVGQIFIPSSPVSLWSAARWSGNGDPQILGGLPGSDKASATGVNGDGSIVVGWSSEHIAANGANQINIDRASVPFVWTAGGGMKELPLPFFADGSANGISANGTTVVGSMSGQGGAPIAGIWQVDPLALGNPNGGPAPTFHVLGALPGGTYSEATSVSADGSIVVGHSTTNNGAESAFLWTNQTGMIDLNSYLPAAGIDINSAVPTSMHLIRANAISADGRTIVGEAYVSYGGDYTYNEGFILTLPVPEPPSFVLLLSAGCAGLISYSRSRRASNWALTHQGSLIGRSFVAHARTSPRP